MPVIAVDNIGIKAKLRNSLNDGAAEVHILLAFGLAAAVDLVAEVFLIVNEIYGNAVYFNTLNTHIFLYPANEYFKVKQMLYLILVLVLDDLVIGGNNSGIDTELCQILRQSADNVSKTAGLAQGCAFSSSQQNLGHLSTAALFKHLTKFLFHYKSSYVLLFFYWCKSEHHCRKWGQSKFSAVG